MIIRPAIEADFGEIVRINSEAEAFLNSQASLTVSELRRLNAIATYFKVACVDDAVAGFLIAVRSDIAHDDPNFRWFSARYPEFLYIDRIIIDARARGEGLGKAMYTDLFAAARELGATRLTCEIDCDPPNHASSIFHARFGFSEAGRHEVDGGKKMVSLQVAPVA
jgi:uncharacterized protein